VPLIIGGGEVMTAAFIASASHRRQIAANDPGGSGGAAVGGVRGFKSRRKVVVRGNSGLGSHPNKPVAYQA